MIRLSPVEFHVRHVGNPESQVFAIDRIRDHLDVYHGNDYWIDLWHLPLEMNDSWQSALESLRKDERMRANRMHAANARKRFILDHAWRNTVLGLYTDADATYTLARSRLGKERVLGDTAPGVSFSRTGSRAVAAISNFAEVGVDIEDCHPRERWLSLAQIIDKRDWPTSCTSAAERACWSCRQFVAKEALLKGVGIGLNFPLQAIEMRYSAMPTELYQKAAPRQRSRRKIWQVISEMRDHYSLAVAIKIHPSVDSCRINEFYASGGDVPHSLSPVTRIVMESREVS